MTLEAKVPVEHESNPVVELLNQTCLDLVAEIEKLKGENLRLKNRVRAAAKARREKPRKRSDG